MNPALTRVAAWRTSLADARERLCANYLVRPHATRLLHGLAHEMDRLLRTIWQAHALPRRAALVAVGGYGRGELYPQSDVDVLILLDDALDADARARFEPLIGLLWDVGVPIGHSVRSLAECAQEAAGDVTIQTNLLEARVLAGDHGLWARLSQTLHDQLDPVAFFEAKNIEQKVRHGRHSDAATSLEPNLKETPGGLRDVQTLLWIARAAGHGTRLSDLARAGLLRPAEARAASSGSTIE